MTMSFGTLYRVSIFGESHGHAIGAVAHGVPAGTPLDLKAVQYQLDRRRPGQSMLTTQRKETDTVTFLSGVLDGHATGAPIGMTIPNADTDSSKYDRIRHVPRPGHSDYPAHVKYRGHNDVRGGGHFSGRLTAPLTAAGALARQTLQHLSGGAVRPFAAATSIGGVKARFDPDTADLATIAARIDDHPTRCPDPDAADEMAAVVEAARRDQDSVGGVVTCVVDGLPVGLGEPFFDSVESVVAHLMFAIPAVKGVEFGSGFALSRLHGSEANDTYTYEDGKVVTRSNHAGGALGGLTDGARLVFRVAVKPASSIAKEQETVDLSSREGTTLRVTGRHDPCIVPRAVPVIENVVCIGLLDLWSRARAGGLDV
ncbi:MAG: chorismate synthase [Euryarchaeota archaeon]|nr:chorismate synthase [Euryarchaeota archaeon]